MIRTGDLFWRLYIAMRLYGCILIQRLVNYELREDTDIQIYDVVGKLLQSKIVNLQSEIVLDISHLASGLYFLKVDNAVVKIVKN